MDPRDDELRSEYDAASLKEGVTGKYAKQFASGSNLVRIDPDLASAFAGEKAINDALRFMLQLPAAVKRLTKDSG